jgi:hypothetical protein
MSRWGWLTPALLVVAAGACASQSVSRTAPVAASRHVTAQTEAIRGNALADTPNTPLDLVARCSRQQLRSSFYGGQSGLGNEIDFIVVRNHGERPCRIRGRVSFAAFYATGERDRRAFFARDPGFENEFSGPGVSLVLRGRSPGTQDDRHALRRMVAVLKGADRDDPAAPNGECRPYDEKSPRWLDIRIGQLNLRTSNHGHPGRNNMPSVYGCQGRIYLAAILRTD